ncbi:MAG: glycogen debranching protein GlgX [Kiritimatiellae bacterium]|nr:glycogen debranching protein GlgX [Kiritimatiellia bacterium]
MQSTAPLSSRPALASLLPSLAPFVPYGAHPLPDGGVSFAIFSHHATRVWLLLFDAPDAATPAREIPFDPATDRTGDIWHKFIPEARPGQYYLYRMDGPANPALAIAFDPDQWLLDPYALAVAGQPEWGGHKGVRPGAKVKSGPLFPKGIILADDFDWADDRPPRIPLADSVIYETSVRGYTVHSSARVHHPGTFAGLAEKIPYIKSLGVTTVELLPAQEFNEMELFWENGPRRALRNFWGYSTLAFFAPNGRFACANQHGEQVREFKQMVKAFHDAGLEVILDVVFNHTAEGGPAAQTYSFRGIDNPVYYMVDPVARAYRNYSGCGNSFNANHPVVREFILDCLRYWALTMHVDGFRFDLATALTRGRDGDLLANPPLVEAIADDPILADRKIIAEAWDAAGAYQVGSFPSPRWSEWNGKFRDDVRAFWAATPGSLATFATRLCGSPDLYNRDGLTPLKSINYVASHDGFTIHDITAYARKHNLANCEENRDGDNDNRSDNCGREGPSRDPTILARRLRRQKNLLASLFLAQGVPMLLAGDEFSRTQLGNNNAYCQDNEISWVDWRLLPRNSALTSFVSRLIAFRKAHPALRRDAFFSGNAPDADYPDLRWYAPDGAPLPDWHNSLAVACRIDGRPARSGLALPDDDLYLAFNASAADAAFELPPPAPDAAPWRLEFHTHATPPPLALPSLTLPPESLAVFTSARPR